MHLVCSFPKTYSRCNQPPSNQNRSVQTKHLASAAHSVTAKNFRHSTKLSAVWGRFTFSQRSFCNSRYPLADLQVWNAAKYEILFVWVQCTYAFLRLERKTTHLCFCQQWISHFATGASIASTNNA